jgi:hypothetical protein
VICAIIVHHALLLFFIRLDKIGLVDVPIFRAQTCVLTTHIKDRAGEVPEAQHMDLSSHRSP